MSTDTTTKLDNLSSDVQAAISGAEDMLRQAKAATGDKAAELRERAMEQLKAVREKMHDAQQAVIEKGRAAARVTDDFVHENPWKAIGAGMAAGVLIGLLLNRR